MPSGAANSIAAVDANCFASVLGVPTSDAPQTVKAILSQRSIAAAVRAGEVRISFHVYNTDEHVEAAVDALRPLVKRR